MNKKSRLNVLEDKSGNIRIVNLSNAPVNSVDDVIDVLAEGSKCRTSGQTSANSNSSRSHAVFQLILMKGKKMHGTVGILQRFSCYVMPMTPFHLYYVMRIFSFALRNAGEVIRFTLRLLRHLHYAIVIMVLRNILVFIDRLGW